MPKRELTEAVCRGVKARAGQTQDDQWDTKVSGFGLRVTDAGKKTFVFRYRWQGVRRRLVLGGYGNAPPNLSLSDARKVAAQLAAALRNGVDPGREIDAAKTRRTYRDQDTVALAIEQHIKRLRGLGKSENYLKDMEQRFNLHVIPAIGDRPIRDVQPAEIEKILAELVGDQKRHTRNQILVMLRPVFAAAKISPNPCDDFKRLKTSRRTPGVFDPEDFASLWLTLDDPEAGCAEATTGAIRLAMLTLKRGNEVAGARIQEFDLERRVWEIPAERMKNRTAETVPLSRQACDLVRRAIFTPLRTLPVSKVDALFFWKDQREPIQRNAMTRAFVRAKRICLEGHPGTLHNLRHSFVTLMARCGAPGHVASALLSHTAPSEGAAAITKVYQLYNFDVEKRDYLDRWGNALEWAIGSKVLALAA